MTTMDAHRRLYLFKKLLTLEATRYDVLNEDILFKSSKLGSSQYTIPNAELRGYFGLPEMNQRPLLRLTARRQLLDFYGYGPYFVSSAAREYLMDIDPIAFEFAECETVGGNGERLDPYWMMGVTRLVMAFDEQKSEFITYSQQNPDAPDATINPLITELIDIRLMAGFPKESHAFRFSRYIHYFVADEQLIDGWIKAGLRGAQFTPLQRPTLAERKRQSRYNISAIWHRRLESESLYPTISSDLKQ